MLWLDEPTDAERRIDASRRPQDDERPELGDWIAGAALVLLLAILALLL